MIGELRTLLDEIIGSGKSCSARPFASATDEKSDFSKCPMPSIKVCCSSECPTKRLIYSSSGSGGAIYSKGFSLLELSMLRFADELVHLEVIQYRKDAVKEPAVDYQPALPHRCVRSALIASGKSFRSGGALEVKLAVSNLYCRLYVGFSVLSVLPRLWWSYNSVIKYVSDCKVCARGKASPPYIIQ